MCEDVREGCEDIHAECECDYQSWSESEFGERCDEWPNLGPVVHPRCSAAFWWADVLNPYAMGVCRV